MGISRNLHLYSNKTKFLPRGCTFVKFLLEKKRTKEFINLKLKIKES